MKEGGQKGDGFGFTADIEGDTVVVGMMGPCKRPNMGAHSVDFMEEDQLCPPGFEPAVYVYHVDGSLVATLTAPDGTSSEFTLVSLSRSAVRSCKCAPMPPTT